MPDINLSHPNSTADSPLGLRMPMRILLVDDNDINLKIGSTMLAHLGYSAEKATDGQKAVEAVEKGEFDLVLLDVHMPVMDGYEASRVINQILPGGRRPIIVALTASVLKTDRENCLAAGMNDFLSKPIRIKDLQCLLEKWYPVVVKRHSESDPCQQVCAASTVCSKDEEVVLNESRLMEMCDNSPEMLREIVELYLDQAESSLAKLTEIISQNQLREIEAIAHKLAGSSATCGMPAMAAALRRLEIGARESRCEVLPTLLSDAVGRFSQLREHLVEHLHANSNL